MIHKVKYRVKKLSDAIALLSIELVVVFITFIVSLGVLIVVIRQIFYHDNFTLDQTVFNYLSGRVTNSNTSAMLFISFLGSHLFLIPAWLAVLVFYYFIKKNKWHFIKLLTIALSNLLLMFGLKFFFNRPRPLIPLLKEAPGLSFPSGHAFMSFIFFGLMIYLVYRHVKHKWLKWITVFTLALIIFMIGLSRVYLRVHYASDVIAGFCFGLISLLILLWLLRQIEKYNAKKIPGQLNITGGDDDIAAGN